ncbi:hypothetical protein CHS0354_037602 [Potamilus streckersoni]|uniref:CS domain-containing protein n=1 Tax=Potamilus streckersoni TaxID=2493646 RepID=A0AAE0RYH6_9BIVA|nr:hypothetical protein CHS0354_037602 [Potamilus streckersoni]
MAEAPEFETPSYACDEKTKEGYLRVIVSIRGLKMTSKIILKGIIPKSVKEAENAEVDSEFEERSFLLTVRGRKGELINKNYQLRIQQLPHEIISNQSYIKIEDNRILVFLKKLEDRSWYPELDAGLETAEEEM